MAISLAEHSLAHETRLIDLQNKPADFLAVFAAGCADPSPAPSSGWARAKVPVLEAGDDVLLESQIICEYLEEMAGAPQTGTFISGGEAAARRARSRLWAANFPSAISYIPILRAEEGSDEEAAAVDALREGMRSMERFLAATQGAEAGGPFLHGQHFSLAEICTAPMALRFMAVLPGLRPSLDPTRMLEEDGLHRLRAWLEAVCLRPSCVATAPPPAELVTGYSSFLAKLKAGGYGGK